jgi:hypothetical protein
MGNLFARLQEIIGEKIFRHKVTFDGDVVFKKHITGYAPVPGEPSLGTLHYHPSQYAANVYTNTAPSATTFYTVTVAGLPAGTKTIEISGYILGTAASDELVWRPYGSADTYLQSIHRSIGMVPSASGYGHIQGTVNVDSSGRFQVAVNDNGTDIYIRGYSFYGI